METECTSVRSRERKKTYYSRVSRGFCRRTLSLVKILETNPLFGDARREGNAAGTRCSRSTPSATRACRPRAAASSSSTRSDSASGATSHDTSVLSRAWFSRRATLNTRPLLERASRFDARDGSPRERQNRTQVFCACSGAIRAVAHWLTPTPGNGAALPRPRARVERAASREPPQRANKGASSLSRLGRDVTAPSILSLSLSLSLSFAPAGSGACQLSLPAYLYEKVVWSALEEEDGEGEGDPGSPPPPPRDPGSPPPPRDPGSPPPRPASRPSVCLSDTSSHDDRVEFGLGTLSLSEAPRLPACLNDGIDEKFGRLGFEK